MTPSRVASGPPIRDEYRLVLTARGERRTGFRNPNGHTLVYCICLFRGSYRVWTYLQGGDLEKIHAFYEDALGLLESGVEIDLEKLIS